MSGSCALPCATPESQGLPSAAILAFIEALESKIDSPNGLILVRHGHVVAQGWWRPFMPEYRHMLFSLSKSFTSTAVGLAVAEGLLVVDDTVVSFFPDDAPGRGEPEPGRHARAPPALHDHRPRRGYHRGNARAGRMATGRALFWRGRWSTRRARTSCTTAAPPTCCRPSCSSVTGQTVLDYLTPRLFEPLGITDPTWETCPRGINTGGWGLSIQNRGHRPLWPALSAEGRVAGPALLPEAWVAEATAWQICQRQQPNQPTGGRATATSSGAAATMPSAGDGAFGQFCVVMPEQDAVLAMTDGTSDMQGVLDLVWEHLLPAMTAEPLAPDPEGQARLAAKLAGLELPTPQGAATVAMAERVNGRIYALEANDLGQTMAQFTFSGAGSTLRFAGGEAPLWIGSGYGAWMPGEIGGLGARSLGKVAAAGAWAADDTYVSQIWAHETPFRITVTSRFEGEQVTISLAFNVGMQPAAPMVLKGRLQ